MPRTPMMTSVLQATLLFSLAQLFSHYSLEHAMDPFEQYQEAYKANRSEEILQGVNDRWLEAGAIPANMSVTNLTSTDNKASNGTTATSDEPVPFYTNQFPKAVVTILIMSFLRYYWLIWIERLLPARSRGSTGPSPARPSEKEDDDDAREEEIIRKWVESGKVRRASLNWCNTFLKWMLDMTAGNLWAAFVEMVLVEVMKLKWPWTDWDKWEFLAQAFIRCFGVAPFATLVAFILIPAHKRIVFEGGVDLAWNVFLGVSINVVGPWAVKTEFVQMILRNMTENDLPQDGTTSGLAQRLDEVGVDEL